MADMPLPYPATALVSSSTRLRVPASLATADARLMFSIVRSFAPRQLAQCRLTSSKLAALMIMSFSNRRMFEIWVRIRSTDVT